MYVLRRFYNFFTVITKNSSDVTKQLTLTMESNDGEKNVFKGWRTSVEEEFRGSGPMGGVPGVTCHNTREIISILPMTFRISAVHRYYAKI